MWTNVTQLASPLISGGRQYTVFVEGQSRPDGTWAGRLVFRDGADSRTTDQETSQPNREALEYWATGLEVVYLEGAFTRGR
jgi:hypothetical protein